MGKALIIVESPAKVKTIKKFLGADYSVQASVGHVRDLPVGSIGVDESHDFAPDYQIIPGKEKIVAGLQEAAAKADEVFLAPDPDREGEAIAWHVAELIRDKNPNIKRIQFNEITARAVRDALAHPRELNRDLYDAQQARRVLDRLVGYKISPLLWKKVKRGISAGRVQSVALRLIVEREHERRAFKPEEYWVLTAHLQGNSPPPFTAELFKVEGKKPVIANEEAARKLEEIIRAHTFETAGIEEKERSREPQPPFITSTLQQAANQRLGYPARRTMTIAQRLYEGVDLDELGTVALITYMRTDSVRIADEARDAAREYILSHYGADYYPPKPRAFKSKGSAQDAHEAIRPVDVNITPESIKGQVPPDQYQLYKLIWSRFVASQMAAARFHDTTVSIANGPALWRARGERLLFPGFLAVFPQKDDTVLLPPLVKGETLKLEKLDKEQKFTQPPARYTEASLVRELEEKGIGRPSTYASIISTLLDREYAKLEDKHFMPTDLGDVVCRQLTGHFGSLMDVNFTATMEDSLDKVAEGKENWVALLKGFSHEFNDTLANAAKTMESVKTGVPTGLTCPQCGKELVVKFGKAGTFLACSGYPECTFTSNFTRDENGNIQLQEKVAVNREVVGKCPLCNGDLVVKKARTGSRFIACSNYPDCEYAKPFSTGIPCPRDGCNGVLVEKSSRRGKVFYACDQYPKCDYAVWDPPVNEPCPQCGSKILTLKTTRGVKRLVCPEKNCKYVRKLGEDESGAADGGLALPLEENKTE